jgi:hypothetical protein
MVKIEFVMDHEDQQLRDCIVLPEDHGLSIEQIEQIKQKRFVDWVASMNPVEEPEFQVTEDSE